ncbi:MAG TPA: deoxyribonuclease IV, partial [Candidatus Fraserbacteria bacterium]|nr:deoxyribonuclease IV [Candidatus Fraserbacteria bacterium]
EHIGRGYIGLDGFRLLVNHPRLRALPFVLETPKEVDETDKLDSKADPINLAAVRALRG